MVKKYVIYKIYNIEKPENYYIGSTNNFSSRKSHHKKNVNNRRHKKYWSMLYWVIRDDGGWDKYNMEIVETLETMDKTEVRKKEQEYIDNLNPPLNSICSYIEKRKIN